MVAKTASAKVSKQQARLRWLEWLSLQGIRPARFQQRAWRAFEDGLSGLICAPTGSGKTLAATGGPLQQAMATIDNSRAQYGVRILWVTPLRALASDTARHLIEPVQALLPHWRVGLRTSDASAKDRTAAQKGRVQLLVITPESLAILLSQEVASASFATLQAVVVDEWHELLASKRGVLLQLNLARLRQLAPKMQIWGVSATIGNAHQACEVLVRERAPSQITIVRDERCKPFELHTLLPPETVRLPWAGHLGLANLGEVLQQVLSNESTIIFTNTRAQAELWFNALASIWPLDAEQLQIHHGSLDQAMRQKVEAALRQRTVRCVVATSSLDLGVDFPAVDLVMQIGGAHSVSRLMQRAGRAKHRPGVPVSITTVATQAMDVCEFAATRLLAQKQSIESRAPWRLCLDVLSQHVMSVSLAGGFESAALLEEVRTTDAFAQLDAVSWQQVLDFLVQGGQALEAYPQYRRLMCDEGGRYVPIDAKVARRHRLAIGTITEQSMVKVQFLRGAKLGSVEEAFINKLVPGDVFNFAGRSLELFRVENMTAWVRKSSQKGTRTPAWTGGSLPFSGQVGNAMKELLAAACYERSADQPPEMHYLQPLVDLQKERTHVPAGKELLVECITTKDRKRRGSQGGVGSAWFIYPFAGRALHEGLALLIAHRLAKKQPNTFTWACTHIGLMLMPAQAVDIEHFDWTDLLNPDQLVQDLAAAVNFSELARRRFREVAQIAGLLNAKIPGMSFNTRQLQVSAGLLFDVLSKYDAQHVLLQAARQEAMERDLLLMDLAALLEQLQRHTVVIKSSPKHTPFSFGIWAESMRGQLSNESWADRIQRMAQTMDR
jgi:ATP-dependent helicase Lhr and Lhr-like helicase